MEPGREIKAAHIPEAPSVRGSVPRYSASGEGFRGKVTVGILARKGAPGMRKGSKGAGLGRYGMDA